MQANNAVTKVWGEKLVASPGLKLKNHVDLVELLDIADTKRGTDTFFVTVESVFGFDDIIVKHTQGLRLLEQEVFS